MTFGGLLGIVGIRYRVLGGQLVAEVVPIFCGPPV